MDDPPASPASAGGPLHPGERHATATATQYALAYAVHLFTASGVIFAFLAVAEVCKSRPDPRLVFLYLAIQCLIDAADGPLARALHVKTRAARIDGRTIDDIVDYLTYTFIPLLLVWKAGWLPGPAGAFVAPAMVASLFGFSNTAAKDEGGGFFLGFPSYWNIVAVYVGVWFHLYGPWPGALTITALSVLTVLPVRFVYPNLAPRPWKVPVLVGALLWTVLLGWIIWRALRVEPWVMWLSLVYPAFYVALSIVLDWRTRRIRDGSSDVR